MGGILIPGTTIHGGIDNPGIPFSDSPSGGFYETGSGGLGVSLASRSFLEVNNLGATLGYKPPQPFQVSALSGSPYATSTTQPVDMVTTPDGLHVIAIVRGTNSLDVFSRNTATGELTRIASYVVGGTPYRLCVSPDGLHIYVSNDTTNTVNLYVRNAVTGALSVGASYGTANTPYKGEVTLNGNFVVIPNANSNSISVFSRNKTTGALTPVAGSPFATGNTPQHAKISPDNLHVYVSCGVSHNLYAYSINNTTGALSAIAGSPYATGVNCNYVAVSPNGLFVYATNTSSNTISGFVRDAVTGKLTAIVGSPFDVGAITPWGVIVSPDSNYLFFTGANNLYVYSIDQATGVITNNVYGSPFAAGLATQGITVSPDGLNAYVCDSGGSSLHGYQNQSLITYNLLTTIFDPTGLLGGVFNINGVLQVLGDTVLSSSYANAKYAAINGLITIPFSAKSLTLDHAAGGLVGTPTNNDALAGMVGEYIQASVAAGAAVALTTNVAATVTSIALTAGDWDVEGVIAYHSSGTTNVNDITEGIGTVAATLPVAPGSVNCDYLTIVLPAAPDTAYIAPKTRISLAAPATIYLVCQAHFTVSTLAAYGQINARRVR